MFHTISPQILGLILDMDGVLWRGNQAIVDLPELFADIASMELKVILATNNATMTVDRYLDKLHLFGVNLEPWQIINSAQALGFYLNQRFPQGGPVYVIGEIGLEEALREYGFYPEDSDDVRAVVVGLDRAITYEKLRRGTLLIRSGVPFVATNPDRTYPAVEGLIPGAGAITASLEASTDTKPYYAGKPQKTMFELALERLGLPAIQTLVVGDRLETDIAGGQAVCCRTALVLTGVSTLKEAKSWTPPPDIIASDIHQLISE